MAVIMVHLLALCAFLERGADSVRVSAVLSSYHGASGYREAVCLSLGACQYPQGASLLCSYRYMYGDGVWVLRMYSHDISLLLNTFLCA